MNTLTGDLHPRCGSGTDAVICRVEPRSEIGCWALSK